MRRSLFTVALALIATPVWAQQVRIAFHDGQVSVETVGAPPRAILAEWSKIGGTNIVNAERVTGAPLTLKLVDVPEAQALEIILRSVAGYMAAPRGQTPGASRYDRILVLPTSTTQVAASATTARPAGPPPGPAMGTQRFIPPRPAPTPAEEAPEVDVDDRQEPGAPSEPVFTFPQQPNGYRTVPVQPVGSPPVMGSDGAGSAWPVTAPAAGAPGYGVVGAPVPGMIQVPPAQPQPQQPATPGRPTRPPGQ
jgi:hypothetical protein